MFDTGVSGDLRYLSTTIGSLFLSGFIYKCSAPMISQSHFLVFEMSMRFKPIRVKVS